MTTEPCLTVECKSVESLVSYPIYLLFFLQNTLLSQYVRVLLGTQRLHSVSVVMAHAYACANEFSDVFALELMHF